GSARGKRMQTIAAHIKKEWKVYTMAAWMIGVTGFLFYLNSVVQQVNQTSLKLSSDVDSVESILISTDANVAEIKQQVGDMSAHVAIIRKRMRRR
ncbi:MAG: hypothetical protein PVH26_14755, partial [Desulfosarcina sp.]